MDSLYYKEAIYDSVRNSTNSQDIFFYSKCEIVLGVIFNKLPQKFRNL